MPTEKEILLGVLTKFYSKTEEEIKKAIYDDDGETLSEKAFETISTMDTARVTKLKGNPTDILQNGYKKGKKETMEEAVRMVKDVLDIESDSEMLADVLEAAKEQIAEKTKEKVILPTEEAVKKEPWFIKYEKSVVPKTLLEQKETELAEFKQQVEMDKIFGTVDEEAMGHLQKLNPDTDTFKDTPAVLRTMEQGFKGSLREYDWQPNGSGGYIPIYKSDGVGRNGLPVKRGDRVEDDHGVLLTLDAIVKEKAPNYFRLLKQPPKGSAGNEPPAGGGTGDATKPPVFKTSKDYNAYVNKLDPKDKDYDKKTVEASQIYRKGIAEKTIEIVE